MKTIKIKYCDFFDNLDQNNYWITRILRKHYNIEFSDDPDYVFFSVFGYEHLNYDCIKIFYTGEDFTPDFNLCDYAIGFDYIDFDDRYLRFPWFCMQSGLEKATTKHIFSDEDLKIKTDFCDFVVSNSGADQIRTDFFHLLSQYKKVDSGGKYLNNVGGPVKSKYDFQKTHKFSITFENGSHRGYSSEKILHAFEARTIPIYWGDPTISSQFNSKSFINVHEYSDLNDVVKRVIEIDNNDDLYKQILSEPVFENGVIPEALRIETAEKFLTHIFDQPIESASRRGHHTFRDNAIYHYKKYKKTIDAKQKLIPRIVLKIFE